MSSETPATRDDDSNRKSGYLEFLLADAQYEILRDTPEPASWGPGKEPILGYTIVEDEPGDGGVLGGGGQGWVWNAKNALGKGVVLKYVPKQYLDTARAAQILAAELDAHINVVTIMANYEVDSGLVIIMPKALRSLAEYVDEKPWTGQADERLLKFFEDAAKGIDHLHQNNILHRDIKPSNLLEYDGGVVVADLDLIKRSTRSTMSHSGGGTPNYWPPEAKKCIWQKESDQYSLAVTYIELRTGSRNGLITNPEETKVLQRALAPSPADRWPKGCFQFIKELKKAALSTNVQVDRRRSYAERTWYNVQDHHIGSLKFLFMLKEAVGFKWLREVLDDTTLTFSGPDRSLTLGQVLDASTQSSIKGESQSAPVSSFWELYGAQPGYWCKRVGISNHELALAAGFDVEMPWGWLNLNGIEKLRDLSLMTLLQVSIPARACMPGIENVVLTFQGKAFSFDVRLSDHGLEDLRARALIQMTQNKSGRHEALEQSFQGNQLLNIFFDQLMADDRPSLQKSVSDYQQHDLISFFPGLPPKLQNTSPVKAEAKDYENQINDIESKLQTSPTDTILYGQLATIYAEQGKLHEALKCLNDAIKQCPPSAAVHAMLGELFQKIGRFDDSLLHFQKAASVGFEGEAHHASHMNTSFGILLCELGKAAEAAEHFEAAVRMTPSNAICHSNLASLLMRLDRNLEAIVPARRAVELEPENGVSVMRLVLILDSAGQIAIAGELLERATRLLPDDAWAHWLYGEYLTSMGQTNEAMMSWQRAIDIDPISEWCELIGDRYVRLEQWQNAEAAYRRGVGADGSNKACLLGLGVSQINLKKYRTALDSFERAALLEPGNLRLKEHVAKLKDMMMAADNFGLLGERVFPRDVDLHASKSSPDVPNEDFQASMAGRLSRGLSRIRAAWVTLKKQFKGY